MLMIKNIVIVLQWAPSIGISTFWVLRSHILETSLFVHISGEEMEENWLEDYFFIIYRKILLDPRVFWFQSKVTP